MTSIEPDPPEQAGAAPHSGDTCTSAAFLIGDPDLDEHLDPDQFRQGFEDGTARLAILPRPWARHHASSTIASSPDPDDDEPSWTRGYRAALYGYLRHSVD